MTDMENNLDSISDVEGDPAEYLLSNSKYHDCYLTVGDPETDEVEKIGVASVHLISHSSVFRDMLADSKLADPTGSNTHIKDVSPATFKLMLRHVYGGKLPKMAPEEAAKLALCADKYNIQRLVRKATKQIKPTSAEDVFPALMCAVYLNCPDIELQVTKIIQEETEKIVQNPNFAELDVNCILFITKQSILNISEVELWNSLVSWAESQIQKHPQKTLRGCLHKLLPYVRLLSLSLEEIEEHVLPTKILTPDEMLDLTLAVTNKRESQSTGLCKFHKRRVIYKENLKNANYSDQVSHFNKKFVFKPQSIDASHLQGLETKEYSTLTIEPLKRVCIDSFTFRSLNMAINNNDSFKPINFTCFIWIYTYSSGLITSDEAVKLTGRAVPNQVITLPVKKNNGQPLILETKKIYTFKILMTPPFPVNKLISGGFSATCHKRTDGQGLSVKYEDEFHIMEIAYSVQE